MPTRSTCSGPALNLRIWNPPSTAEIRWPSSWMKIVPQSANTPAKTAPTAAKEKDFSPSNVGTTRGSAMASATATVPPVTISTARTNRPRYLGGEDSACGMGPRKYDLSRCVTRIRIVRGASPLLLPQIPIDAAISRGTADRDDVRLAVAVQIRRDQIFDRDSAVIDDL